MDDEGFGATADDVRALVRRSFTDEQQHRLSSLLEAIETAVPEHSARRVQVAALMLAQGDISTLEYYAAMAATDYRDVLAPAFYPNG